MEALIKTASQPWRKSYLGQSYSCRQETLIHCWFGVHDAGPSTNQHWVNILCFLSDSPEWPLHCHTPTRGSAGSHKKEIVSFILCLIPRPILSVSEFDSASRCSTDRAPQQTLVSYSAQMTVTAHFKSRQLLSVGFTQQY